MIFGITGTEYGTSWVPLYLVFSVLVACFIVLNSNPMFVTKFESKLLKAYQYILFYLLSRPINAQYIYIYIHISTCLCHTVAYFFVLRKRLIYPIRSWLINSAIYISGWLHTCTFNYTRRNLTASFETVTCTALPNIFPCHSLVPSNNLTFNHRCEIRLVTIISAEYAETIKNKGYCKTER
jgi:hypothetical protein